MNLFVRIALRRIPVERFLRPLLIVLPSILFSCYVTITPLKIGIEPLERIGLLYNKKSTIKRYFVLPSLFFVIRGSGWLRQNGKTITLQAPFAMINVPGDGREYGPDETWDELFFGYNDGAEQRFATDLFAEPFEKRIWPIHDLPGFMQYFKLVTSIIEQPLVQEFCGQLDLLAACMLNESRDMRYFSNSSQDNKRLLALHSWLNDNFRNDFNLSSLTSEFGFSYPTFRRLWKKRFLISPHQYVMRLRNEFAQQLLVEGNWSVSDVAEKSGFNDAHYFSRIFKQLNGITPLEYRKYHEVISGYKNSPT
jgi:AraC-like DNA-binding protein